MVVFVPMATDFGNSFPVARRKCPVVTGCLRARVFCISDANVSASEVQ